MRQILFAISLAVVNSSANAGILFHTYDGETTTIGNKDRVHGVQFTVGGQDIEISQLGVYDKDGDGLTNTHTVGIWDLGGTLLASKSIVGAGGTLIEDWRFLAISPLTLLANTNYRIGGAADNSNDGQPSGGTVLTDSQVTKSGTASYYSGTTGLNFPETTNVVNRVVANAFIASAPEPGSVAFLSLGLVCYGFAIYRRKKR
jgi:hypothetical protein